MTSFLTDIESLMLAAGAIAAAGFMLHAAYSIINLLRLRGLRMSWGHGRFGPVPLHFWPCLILLAIAATLFWQPGSDGQALAAGVMGWVGIHGMVAALLSGRVYITDHGVVTGLNRQDGTVAWYQITDYACREENGKLVLLLIYQQFRGARGEVQPCSRKTLVVPSGKRREFEKIVSCKLGKTIDKTVLPAGDLRLA